MFVVVVVLRWPCLPVCVPVCMFSISFSFSFWHNFSFHSLSVRLIRMSEHFFEMPKWKAKSRRANALMIFRMPLLPPPQPPGPSHSHSHHQKPAATATAATTTTTAAAARTRSDKEHFDDRFHPLRKMMTLMMLLLLLLLFLLPLMMMFVGVCVCVRHGGRHINLGEWHAWRLTERDYRVFALPDTDPDPSPGQGTEPTLCQTQRQTLNSQRQPEVPSSHCPCPFARSSVAAIAASSLLFAPSAARAFPVAVTGARWRSRNRSSTLSM